jgi:hypothetical protein
VTVHACSSGVDQLIDAKCDRASFVKLMSAKIANLWAPTLPLKLSECVVVIGPEHYRMLHESGVRSKEHLAQLLFDESNAICQSTLSLALRVSTINQVGVATSNVLGLVGYVLSAVGWLLQKSAPVTSRSPLNRTAWIFMAMWFIRRRGRTGVTAVAAALMLGWTGLLRKLARLTASTMSPKMFKPSSIHIVVSGSSAGKFSCVMPGFGCGLTGFGSGLKNSMKLSTCVTEPIPSEPTNMRADAAALESVVAASDHAAAAKFPMVVCNPRGKCGLAPLVQAKRGIGGGGEGVPPRVLGMMDISKPGGSIFFDRLAELMVSAGGVTTVRRYQKPTFSKQCPDSLRRRIASECDSVVLALAD